MAIRVSGLAVPFGVAVHMEPGNHTKTSFAPGAFRESVAVPKSASSIEAYVGHQRHATIARRRDGDIGLCETEAGLMFQLHIDDPHWGSIILRGALHGYLHGVSIRWAVGERARWDGDTKIIVSADLIELSLVMFDMRPKFPGTWMDVEPVAA